LDFFVRGLVIGGGDIVSDDCSTSQGSKIYETVVLEWVLDMNLL